VADVKCLWRICWPTSVGIYVPCAAYMHKH